MRILGTSPGCPARPEGCCTDGSDTTERLAPNPNQNSTSAPVAPSASPLQARPPAAPSPSTQEGRGPAARLRLRSPCTELSRGGGVLRRPGSPRNKRLSLRSPAGMPTLAPTGPVWGLPSPRPPSWSPHTTPRHGLAGGAPPGSDTAHAWLAASLLPAGARAGAEWRVENDLFGVDSCLCSQDWCFPGLLVQPEFLFPHL